MTSTLRLIACAAALAACATAQAQQPATQTCKAVTEAEVAALFDRWNQSLASGDPAKVVANYAERSILLATVANDPRQTTAQRLDYFKDFLKDKPQGKIDLRMIELGCNTALDAGVYTFTFGRTGAVVQARYSYTYRWDGAKWLITSHHSSAMPQKK